MKPGLAGFGDTEIGCDKNPGEAKQDLKQFLKIYSCDFSLMLVLKPLSILSYNAQTVK